MAFWLQFLGPGTVSGSWVLIPFHLGLLTNRKQSHALSARHWTYAKKLDKWSVQSADVVDNGRVIAAAIIRGSARAVSDGSFKNAMGTSASILVHSKATDLNRLISVNSVPGNREEQSAYRSELAGVSGSLSLIAAVCMVHDIHTGSITIGLDGEQAMIAASEDWPLSPARPDYNLLTYIQAKVRGLPIKINWK
jgi:hypothetical protein